MENNPKKILLGMLVSNGDCLMATVIAAQVKQDYPGCILTWAISPGCRQVIENNPDVDVIWDIPIKNKQSALSDDWRVFRQEAEQKKERGEFDEVFFLQIYPDNVWRFDGTTRGTIYNAYPGKITVDCHPRLRLYDAERIRVDEFAKETGLTRFNDVILFECTALSGQSFVTPAWALEVSRELVKRHDDLFILLSTHEPITTNDPRIVCVSNLTLRENAALSHHCSLFVGCSSGITWICTSTAAKLIPMVQFLNRGIGFTFASVVYDHQRWGLNDDHILESTKKDVASAVEIIDAVIVGNVKYAKARYHEVLRPTIKSMVKYTLHFAKKAQFAKAISIIRNFRKRPR